MKFANLWYHVANVYTLLSQYRTFLAPQKVPSSSCTINPYLHHLPAAASVLIFTTMDYFCLFWNFIWIRSCSTDFDVWLPSLNIVFFRSIYDVAYISTLVLLIADWLSLVCEGVLNESPQDVPLWHVDYLEQKAIETLQAQEKLLLLP